MVATSFKQKALRGVRGSIPLTCLAFALDNLLSTFRVTRPDPAPDEHLAGADIESDLWYARRVADMYLSNAPAISGRVAEVGPGGSALVALLLLNEGCDQVDLVDRFSFAHDATKLADMYDRLIDQEPALKARFGDRRGLAPEINYHFGEHAAAEIYFTKNHDYDAILSCAVLEHLYDPLAAVRAMAGALNPGGRLLHQVDLRDHGMFTAGGHHELTFLTIPTWLYPSMTRRRGRPNRVLFPSYRETLTELGLDYDIRVTHLVGMGPVDPAPYERIPAEQRMAAIKAVRTVRPRLAGEFRSMTDEDLSIASFFMSAVKS